jgi:hypothetical protein
MTSDQKKNTTRQTSARGGRFAGSGARGRQGATVERSQKGRLERVATGTASTERDHGRSKTDREGREHRKGTA